MPHSQVKQYSTATSGSLAVPDTQQDTVLIHNGASVALTMTITFPPNPVDGQLLTLCSGAGITTLTLSSVNSILGGLGSMAVGGFASWVFNADANKWFRCG